MKVPVVSIVKTVSVICLLILLAIGGHYLYTNIQGIESLQDWDLLCQSL